MTRTMLIALGSLVLLFGCFAVGTNFKWKSVRTLEIGMSKAEVTELLGPPYQVNSLRTAQGDKEVWVWVYVDAFMGSKSLSLTFIDEKLAEIPKIPDSFKD